MRNYNSIFKSQQKSIKSLDKCQRTLIDNGGGGQKWSINSQKTFQLQQWFKSQLNNSCIFCLSNQKRLKKAQFDKQKNDQ